MDENTIEDLKSQISLKFNEELWKVLLSNIKDYKNHFKANGLDFVGHFYNYKVDYETRKSMFSFEVFKNGTVYVYHGGCKILRIDKNVFKQ